MAGVRTKRLRWSMFWAVVSYVITILGTQLTNYLTALDVSPFQGALISTGVGLGVVLIGVVIDHARDDEPETAAASAGQARAGHPVQGGYPGPVQPGYPVRHGQPAKKNGRTSLAGALVIILLLCGGGGLAITYGAQWAASQVVSVIADLTGESKANPGQERLAAPVSKTSGVLTITVNSVQVNERATVVNLTATNAGNSTLTLASSYFQLTVPRKATLKADPFVGSWDRGEVPPNGGVYNGTIIFDGVLAADTGQVTLAITEIFAMDFGAPRNISVNIPLTSVSAP